MTHQEVFNKVYLAIIAQGEPSSDGKNCLYRGPNGLKCAAGHLVPDDKYDPDWETFDVPYIVRKGKLDFGVPTAFVQSLQNAHDNAECDGGKHFKGADFISRFTSRMKGIAKMYNLVMP